MLGFFVIRLWQDIFKCFFNYGDHFFFCKLLKEYYISNRSISKSEEDIPIPPLLQSAALWGKFQSVIQNFYLLPFMLYSRTFDKTYLISILFCSVSWVGSILLRDGEYINHESYFQNDNKKQFHINVVFITFLLKKVVSIICKEVFFLLFPTCSSRAPSSVVIYLLNRNINLITFELSCCNLWDGEKKKKWGLDNLC